MLVPSVNVFAAQEAADVDATTNKKALGSRLTISDYNAIVDILAPLNVNAGGELTTEGLLTVPSFILNGSTTQTGIIEDAVDVATDWASPSNATLATSAAVVAYVTDRVKAPVDAGTADFQALYWNNTNSKWEPTAEIAINPGTGVTAASGLTVTAGGADITGDSSITGALTVSTTLGVTGITTLKDNVAIRNDADDADFVLFDNTSGSEAVTITGVLNASGLASLDGGIDMDGVFTVADATGNVATTGTLSAAATTVTSTLDVTSLASLDGGIDMDGVFTVADTTGNVATTGTLAVTGVTTVTGGLADANTAVTVPLSDAGSTTLPSGSVSILDALSNLDGASSTMETLANLNIYIGSGTDQAIEVDPTGEWDIAVDGTTTLDNDSVTGKVLTGFVSGAGTVAATDTILESVEKMDGNIIVNATNIATNATNIQDINALTEDYMYVGNSSDVIEAVEVNSTVTGQVLTGFVAAAGTVVATDTILESVEKLAGTQAEMAAGIDLDTQTSLGTCDNTHVGQMKYLESTNGGGRQEGAFWGCVATDPAGVQTYTWVALSIFEG